MKIYILTYTFKTFFSLNKRHSGIDAAALAQFDALTELGHDVRLFHAQGELNKKYNNIDYFIDHKVQNPKDYARKNKSSMETKMINSIKEFKPDIIISNYEFNKTYEKLNKLNIPMIYISHAMPGFWQDFLNANLLYEIINSGNTFCCVSEYHKNGIEKYYKSKRKEWIFDSIIPDYILPPQYSNKEEVKESDGVIRHCSAASKGKDTFLILDYLKDDEIKKEVYTTFGFLKKDKPDEYIDNALRDFSENIFIDVDHSEIMNKISSSLCTFVGNYPDTFTITSLESLSRGVPLIVKDKNGHPATEMVPPEFKKYIKLIKNKKDFLIALEELKNISFTERVELANATNNKMGKDNFKKTLTSLLEYTINKYNSTDRIDEVSDEW